MTVTATWITDWSDSEDDDFRWAWNVVGLQPIVIRSTPLGATVGSRWHRLRSYPAYASLAARGLRRARNGPLVAWQPLAGAVAGLLRRGRRPPLVLLNPLLDPTRGGAVQRGVVLGISRADHIVFFSRRAVDAAVGLGVPADRISFVPLGVRAHRLQAAPPGTYVVAVGRDGRDWETLRRAAVGLDLEVRVVGPEPGTNIPGLRLVPPMSRPQLLDLMAGAAAVAVPLLRPERTSGQLAVLDAMAAGRAVVATRTQGTEDYVGAEMGVLVPPGDAGAFRDALRSVAVPEVADAMGAAALKAAHTTFSLTRFVSDIDGVATKTVSEGSSR